jgi:hypothetical protein
VLAWWGSPGADALLQPQGYLGCFEPG